MVQPRTVMPRKSHKPEEIVAKLRQVDVLTSQGQSVAEAIRSIGVSEVTYYLSMDGSPVARLG
jgi:ACT domain-containing protein